ncbi:MULTISPECIES: hypothetical protein [Deinococcus]|uniref:Uncharacterized protein n=1 Tax=Deinococcus phoenicis TaxID=1476583 RepID=A0A016QKB4_9DEIO|nr:MULTISPECIES: hypothetical protein [Deinococcus]EYB66332.1 hypothetical protein DEIPH_ctg139orf0051 [Deinococcus phoenicis]
MRATATYHASLLANPDGPEASSLTAARVAAEVARDVVEGLLEGVAGTP